MIEYISIAAVTAAGGFALTATYFFSDAKKSKQKRLAPPLGTSPRRGAEWWGKAFLVTFLAFEKSNPP
ncbi:hypothetical protein [Pseudomonas sp. AF32]|uniref:hypothetical protein n=1 Tax=Pseudomonas sp. AF32 TaxID=554390 RepID=UPI001EEE65DF|nr:hypothetical protein [Pseudomonas sp. AF32]